MSSKHATRIEAWLRAPVLKGQARALEARYDGPRGDEALSRLAVPARNADLAGLAAELAQVIEGELDGLRAGSHRFRVVALDEAGREIAHTSIRVRRAGGEDHERGGPLASELADASLAALVRQQMRHNEALVRVVTEGALQREQASAAMIDALSARSQVIEEQLFKLLEARVADRGADAGGALLKLADKYGPLVIGELSMHKGKLPEGAIPPLLAEAIRTLTPEQSRQLAEVLTPQQMQAVYQVWRSLDDEDADAPRLNGGGH